MQLHPNNSIHNRCVYGGVCVLHPQAFSVGMSGAVGLGSGDGSGVVIVGSGCGSGAASGVGSVVGSMAGSGVVVGSGVGSRMGSGVVCVSLMGSKGWCSGKGSLIRSASNWQVPVMHRYSDGQSRSLRHEGWMGWQSPIRLWLPSSNKRHENPLGQSWLSRHEQYVF